MARGRKPQLRVGDTITKVSDKTAQGVIVHISKHPDCLGVILDRPYDVHWYPSGRGKYAKEKLLKVKPQASKEE